MKSSETTSALHTMRLTVPRTRTVVQGGGATIEGSHTLVAIGRASRGIIGPRRWEVGGRSARMNLSG